MLSSLVVRYDFSIRDPPSRCLEIDVPTRSGQFLPTYRDSRLVTEGRRHSYGEGI